MRGKLKAADFAKLEAIKAEMQTSANPPEPEQSDADKPIIWPHLTWALNFYYNKKKASNFTISGVKNIIFRRSGKTAASKYIKLILGKLVRLGAVKDLGRYHRREYYRMIYPVPDSFLEFEKRKKSYDIFDVVRWRKQKKE